MIGAKLQCPLSLFQWRTCSSLSLPPCYADMPLTCSCARAGVCVRVYLRVCMRACVRSCVCVRLCVHKSMHTQWSQYLFTFVSSLSMVMYRVLVLCSALRVVVEIDGALLVSLPSSLGNLLRQLLYLQILLILCR